MSKEWMVTAPEGTTPATAPLPIGTPIVVRTLAGEEWRGTIRQMATIKNPKWKWKPGQVIPITTDDGQEFARGSMIARVYVPAGVTP
jgi:hypothetical protein